MNKNKLYEVHSETGIRIRALAVPGGLLLITDTFEESGNGIACALASTFVPMARDELVSFLKGEPL